MLHFVDDTSFENNITPADSSRLVVCRDTALLVKDGSQRFAPCGQARASPLKWMRFSSRAVPNSRCQLHWLGFYVQKLRTKDCSCKLTVGSFSPKALIWCHLCVPAWYEPPCSAFGPLRGCLIWNDLASILTHKLNFLLNIAKQDFLSTAFRGSCGMLCSPVVTWGITPEW